MSTFEASMNESADDRDDPFQYRPMSTAAVVSLVLGLLSPTVFLAGQNSLQYSLMMAPIPVLGLIVALIALARIRAEPDQMSGKNLAVAGLALSVFCLVGGLGFSGYVHATEVPDGYVRTSFYQFKPDDVEMRAGDYVPEDVMALDGKQVFIKGYIRPESTTLSHNLRDFLLVRDNYTCCFGDLSKVKYHDQVHVRVKQPLSIDYVPDIIRVGGTLHVKPENAARGPGNPVFTLDADYSSQNGAMRVER